MEKRAFVKAITLASFASGCSTVPPLDLATGGIPTGAIVQRIKCEISDAFDEKTSEQRFKWLAYDAGDEKTDRALDAFVSETVAGMALRFSIKF